MPTDRRPALFTDRPTLALRLSHNHVSLFALTLIALVLADRFLNEPSSPLLFRASLASGYVALLWLAVTLSLGPLRTIRGHRSPENSHLRRDVGVWTAGTSVLHVVLSLCISTTGMVELHEFFFQRTEEGLAVRTDSLGWANHTGTLATGLALVLLATSSDASLRRLGSTRWKNVQRTVYAVALLVVVHSLLYQSMIERGPLTLAVFWTMVGGVTLLRLWSAVRRRP